MTAPDRSKSGVAEPVSGDPCDDPPLPEQPCGIGPGIPTGTRRSGRLSTRLEPLPVAGSPVDAPPQFHVEPVPDAPMKADGGVA